MNALTLKLIFYIALFISLLACNQQAEVEIEEKSVDELQKELKAEHDAAYAEILNAKSIDEALALTQAYADKLVARQPQKDPAPLPPKRTGDENKYLATDISNSEIEQFKQQKHQLQLNGCTISYNEKNGSITSVTAVLDTLGDNYEQSESNYYENEPPEISYYWPEIGVTIAHKKTEDLHKVTPIILIYFDSQAERKQSQLFKGTLLFQGVPIYKGKKVVDFIENSKFTLDDFIASDMGYYRNYDCFDDESSTIEYALGSSGIWNYKGGGHLMFKDGIDKNNPNPFRTLFIGKEVK